MNRATSSSYKTSLASPNAVQYVRQFPRNFLRPYGKVEDAPDSNLVFHRTKPDTCEWYTRPNIAVSELAETVHENLKIMQQDDASILSTSAKECIEQHLAPLAQILQPFNAKASNSNATRSDVKKSSKACSVKMMTTLKNCFVTYSKWAGFRRRKRSRTNNAIT